MAEDVQSPELEEMSGEPGRRECEGLSLNGYYVNPPFIKKAVNVN